MNYNTDYYKILELDKNSNDEQIKTQYRKLSKIYHPDKENGNEEKFKDINNAYSILSDSKTKQDYDNRSPHGKSYSPFSSFGGPGFEFHFGDGNDFFSQFFGGNSPFGGFNPFGPFHRTEEFRENLDIMTNININLKQIYLNEPITIKYKRNVSCTDCNGTGFDKQSNSDQCEICEGKGKDKYGKICTYCHGDGKVYTGQCKTCNGEKVILKDTELTMQNISKLRSNTKSIQRGYGHQSKHYKEKSGNFTLNVIIDRKDDYEIVNNYELRKTIDVHFQDAIDGNEIVYSHIDDSNLKIKLPTKTKNNDIIRVKEKGLLKDDINRGDLYLKINIIIDYGRL